MQLVGPVEIKELDHKAWRAMQITTNEHKSHQFTTHVAKI